MTYTANYRKHYRFSVVLPATFSTKQTDNNLSMALLVRVLEVETELQPK